MVTTTMCVSGAVIVKAGDGMNSNVPGLKVDSDGAIDVWITEAESLINNNIRFNFTDVYAALNDDVKKTLQEICSALAAIQAIQYDMGGYTSREEAQSMINIQRDAALRGLSIFRDKKVEDFTNAA